jgi:negative regulator of sigma E activity
MKTAMFVVIAVAAMVSLTVVLSTTSAFAINNAQDDKNNPTFPGQGAGNHPNPSSPAVGNTANNCLKHLTGDVGNGQNLPAQCY